MFLQRYEEDSINQINSVSMKKSLFILGCIFTLASCAVHKPEPYTQVFMLDYSILTKRGIFVTESNSVGFDYETIGSVYLDSHGGWLKKSSSEKSEKKKRVVTQDDYFLENEGRPINYGKYEYTDPSLYDAMMTLGDFLKGMGANGIINLKIDVIPENAENPDQNKLIITGMAVRR